MSNPSSWPGRIQAAAAVTLVLITIVGGAAGGWAHSITTEMALRQADQEQVRRIAEADKRLENLEAAVNLYTRSNHENNVMLRWLITQKGINPNELLSKL